MRGACLAIVLFISPLSAEGQANARLGGGVGWVRGTGKADRLVEGEDARTGENDHSFMFVIGLGANLVINDNLGLTLNVRYNNACDLFDERAQWIPVTASMVIQL